MPKKKSLRLIATVIAVVALFTAAEVLAEDCNNLLPGISVTYNGMEQQTDGTYLASYSVSGNKVSELTSVDLALAKSIMVVWTPSGYHFADPGEGSNADAAWGKDFYEQRILTGSPQDVNGSKLFYFKVTQNGETTGGININATRGRTASCTITVPSSGFAQQAVIASKKVITADGFEICVKADPATQCEVKVDCTTGDPDPDWVPVGTVFKNKDGQDFIYWSTPGLPCATFTADDQQENTRYYCSGGRCWAY